MGFFVAVEYRMGIPKIFQVILVDRKDTLSFLASVRTLHFLYAPLSVVRLVMNCPLSRLPLRAPKTSNESHTLF